MWNKLFVLVLVVLTVSFQEGIVSCQNSIDVEDALKQSGDEVLEIRDQSNMKVTDIEKALKEKCEKRGAPNAFELLKDEPHRAKKCINKYINATKIEKELETLQKTDSFEKFAKYCNKLSLIYGCFDNFTLYLRQCMDNKEEESFNKTIDIIKKMKDFICFPDGENLALFVYDGGVNCIKEQQEGVNKCFNENFGAILPSTGDSSDFNCADFDKLRECVNDELKKCQNIKPAKIVDNFFEVLKEQMPCNNEKCVIAVQKNTKHRVTGI